MDDDKIVDAKKYTYFAGGFDHHAGMAVQCGVHCPMEYILSFTRSHRMLQLGKSLGGIAPVTAMVNNFDCKHKHTNKTQLLASDYHTLMQATE